MVRQIIKGFSIIVLFSMLMLHVPPTQAASVLATPDSPVPMGNQTNFKNVQNLLESLNISPGDYIKASNTGMDDFFGYSIDIDGNTMAIGARYEDSNGSDQNDNSLLSSGAVYIFVHENGVWRQQAYLKASNPAPQDYATFGATLSLSGDTIIIGASGLDTDGLNFSGGAYIFVRDGENWTQQAFIKSTVPTENHYFGGRVAIDGDTALIAEPFRKIVAVHVRNGTDWTLQKEILVNNGDSQSITELAISGDTAVIGSVNSNNNTGAVFVYVRNGTDWSLQSNLTSGNPINGGFFGYSADIDGDTVIAGAPNEGRAYVFQRTGSSWAQQGVLRSSNYDLGDSFGYSTSIYGNRVVVGAPYEESPATGVNGDQGNDDNYWNAGAAYVFERDGNTWNQTTYLKASNTQAGYEFGHDVAIADKFVAVGSPEESSNASGVNGDGSNTGASSSGAAYTFNLPQTRWTILHYMAGDNDLNSSFYPIFHHLESMAGLPNLRILVYWDNTLVGDTTYYEIVFDNDPVNYGNYIVNVNKFPIGELNSGDPKTLSDFITWGVKHSPSDYYTLILDDHGSGLGGLAWDDTSNKDFITLAELRTALTDANTQTGRKMDILYMAMCLMGMLEDAYQVRGFADYYIASQDLQTTYVPYLSGFNPQDDPATAAVKLAEAYSNEMIANNTEYTISVADLSQLDNLVTATNQFGAVLAENMVTIVDTVTAVATVVQRFDEDGDSIISISDEYMDLYEFAFLTGIALPDELPIVEKAEGVKFAINNYIIYEKHASGAAKILNDSHGVSIFFPATSSSYYNGDNYDFALGADWVLPGTGASLSTTLVEPTPTWGSFLADYFQFTQPEGPDNPTPPLPITKVQLEPTTFSVFLPLTRK